MRNILVDFLARHEAAAELKVCDRTLDRWRRLGEGPPVTKLGRRVLYRYSSLQNWLSAREQRFVREPDPADKTKGSRTTFAQRGSGT